MLFFIVLSPSIAIQCQYIQIIVCVMEKMKGNGMKMKQSKLNLRQAHFASPMENVISTLLILHLIHCFAMGDRWNIKQMIAEVLSRQSLLSSCNNAVSVIEIVCSSTSSLLRMKNCREKVLSSINFIG